MIKVVMFSFVPHLILLGCAVTVTKNVSVTPDIQHDGKHIGKYCLPFIQSVQLL